MAKSLWDRKDRLAVMTSDDVTFSYEPTFPSHTTEIEKQGRSYALRHEKAVASSFLESCHLIQFRRLSSWICRGEREVGKREKGAGEEEKI